MDTLTVLRHARALIEDERHWTKGEFCDSAGRMCANGAVARVVLSSQEKEDWTRLEDQPAIAALAAVAGDVRNPLGEPMVRCPQMERVWLVNDQGNHGTVLALFDRAIAAEEAKLSPPEIVPQATPRRRGDIACARERVVA